MATPLRSSFEFSQRPKRKLWWRVFQWSAALIVLMLLGILGMLEAIAHRPSPVRETLTAAEINEENANLARFGLIVSDGNFLKEHPFGPPWTSHSLLVPSSWSTEPPIKSLLGSHRVRADLLLDDLDVLEPVMERAYGGWDSAEARGWKWNRWFTDWRKQLAAAGGRELSFNEAFAPIDALLAFQRDNHTQIPLARLTSDGSQTAVLASAPGAPCVEIRTSNGLFPVAANDAGQQARPVKLWKAGANSFVDANYIAMPTSHGTPQAALCGGTWIPLRPVGNRTGRGLSLMLNELRGETLSHDQPRIERLSEGIAYARLPTFGPWNYEHASQQSWAQRRPADRVLIIDMRDNGGGSAEYGLEMLKDWIDERRMVQFEDIGSQITSSCLYAPLKWNYPVQSTPSLSPGTKKYLQGLIDRMTQPYPPGCPRTVDIKPAQWTYLQHRFEPKPGDLRLIVLVNSRCGSDCELLTGMLASLPETIIVGTNTYGVCQFIQPGYSVLPHTGLRYRISLGMSNYYGDNRSVDGYGLDVDVVLPEVDTLNPEQMRELAEAVAKL